MAHIAGLVAANVHPSPFGVADIITTTTHKTLRGTRGGLIFCKPELANKIDSAVFPCCQGGALQHVIAGKAITAEEDCTEEFKQYIVNVVNTYETQSLAGTRLLVASRVTRNPSFWKFLLWPSRVPGGQTSIWLCFLPRPVAMGCCSGSPRACVGLSWRGTSSACLSTEAEALRPDRKSVV